MLVNVCFSFNMVLTLTYKLIGNFRHILKYSFPNFIVKYYDCWSQHGSWSLLRGFLFSLFHLFLKICFKKLILSKGSKKIYIINLIIGIPSHQRSIISR